MRRFTAHGAVLQEEDGRLPLFVAAAHACGVASARFTPPKAGPWSSRGRCRHGMSAVELLTLLASLADELADPGSVQSLSLSGLLAFV